MDFYKNKIDREKLPRHVAIIMDGNGRWAKSKGKERTYGHRNAIRAVRNAISASNEIGVEFLTLYTFSSENWKRPTGEVETLMRLLSETLISEAEEIFRKKLRIHAIGEIEKLPHFVRDQLIHMMDLTEHHKNGNLILALNYGSHKEILEATRQISHKVKTGELKIEEIDEKVFEDHLYTKKIPPVDLLIRTSGEVRISNFLLWQLAYSELQFLNVLWPDFTKEDFFKCIVNYQGKERRFGKTSEQLK
ncbi:MAG: di-trans,poly-cis-decaprenylcistransferase [Bergeyella sp.]|nr:di-trans,poly-cis-decaprenylcistransferase [Bergeyella sp.]